MPSPSSTIRHHMMPNVERLNVVHWNNYQKLHAVIFDDILSIKRRKRRKRRKRSRKRRRPSYLNMFEFWSQTTTAQSMINHSRIEILLFFTSCSRFKLNHTKLSANWMTILNKVNRKSQREMETKTTNIKYSVYYYHTRIWEK